MQHGMKNNILWVLAKRPETAGASLVKAMSGNRWKKLFNGFAKKIIKGLGQRLSREGISFLFCRKKKYGAVQAGDITENLASSHFLKIVVSVRDNSEYKCWDSAGSFELSRSAVTSDAESTRETKISRAAGWIKRRIFGEKPKAEAASPEMIAINSFHASVEECRRLLSDERADRLAEDYFTLIRETK